MRRVLLVVAVLASLAVPRASFASSAVRADADWLLAVQTPEGIITQGIDKTWCVPYFASIGARGLAYAYAATQDARYSDAGWKWLGWYASHMDANGFVTDYRLNGTQWQSTGSMDSTDSYAATFLSAAHDIYAVTADRAKLSALRSGIGKAVSAMDATTDRDGLTWAKPDYRMKYLMDNSEVFEGWVAAQDLGVALGDTTMTSHAKSRADAIRSKISSYGNASQGGYDWAIGETGVHEPLDWSQFYPSASAQAWPVAAGLVAPSSAQPVMQKLDAAQPSWDLPDSRAKIVDHDDVIGYWPAIALGFLKAGLGDRALAGYQRIESYAASQNRYWPFHPGTAGHLIMFAGNGLVNGAAFTPPPQPTPTPTPSPSSSPTPSPSSSPTPSPSPSPPPPSATPTASPTPPPPSPTPSASPTCAFPSRGICELMRRYL